MQAWQKLWPHGVETGLLNTSRQIEQVNWSSDRKAAASAITSQHLPVRQRVAMRKKYIPSSSSSTTYPKPGRGCSSFSSERHQPAQAGGSQGVPRPVRRLEPSLSGSFLQCCVDTLINVIQLYFRLNLVAIIYITVNMIFDPPLFIHK